MRCPRAQGWSARGVCSGASHIRTLLRTYVSTLLRPLPTTRACCRLAACNGSCELATSQRCAVPAAGKRGGAERWRFRCTRQIQAARTHAHTYRMYTWLEPWDLIDMVTERCRREGRVSRRSCGMGWRARERKEVARMLCLTLRMLFALMAVTAGEWCAHRPHDPRQDVRP